MHCEHKTLASCAPSLVRPAVDLADYHSKRARQQKSLAKPLAKPHGPGGVTAVGGEPAGGGVTPPPPPKGARGAPLGLSDLVRLTFGRPLDKTMRMSNWARRPLVPAQITYAALDAHCLVRVFAQWERERLERQIAAGAAEAPPLSDCVPPDGYGSSFANGIIV